LVELQTENQDIIAAQDKCCWAILVAAPSLHNERTVRTAANTRGQLSATNARCLIEWCNYQQQLADEHHVPLPYVSVVSIGGMLLTKAAS